MTGFEPVTSSLPRKCSTAELHRQKSGRRDSNPRPSAWKANALSTELLPQDGKNWWIDSSFIYIKNYPLCFFVGSDGFEPPKATPAELQSAPFVHSGNCPFIFLYLIIYQRDNSLPPDFIFSIPAEPLVGFEPTTPRLQITCSGQLS